MKTAVITGATKGIGRALAERFAAEGFALMVCARSKADLNDMARHFSKEYPKAKLICVQTDMSNKSEVLQFAKQVKEELGEVDVLVNNAGVFIPGLVHEEEDGMLEKMIDTNLYSAYHLSRALVPAMKARKSGSIFNICSVASLIAYPNGGSYSISKFAMLGFSKALRLELKDFGIKVTSVMPGATYTSSWEGVDLPEERFMKAEDVANAIWDVYCLSPQTVVEDLVLRPQLGDI